MSLWKENIYWSSGACIYSRLVYLPCKAWSYQCLPMIKDGITDNLLQQLRDSIPRRRHQRKGPPLPHCLSLGKLQTKRLLLQQLQVHEADVWVGRGLHLERVQLRLQQRVFLPLRRDQVHVSWPLPHVLQPQTSSEASSSFLCRQERQRFKRWAFYGKSFYCLALHC